MSKNGKIFMEADEMRAFVGRKENAYGHGLLLKEAQISLLVLMPEKEMMPGLLPYGSHYLKTAKRTEYFSQTAWPLAEKFFLRKDSGLSIKASGKKSYRTD